MEMLFAVDIVTVSRCIVNVNVIATVIIMNWSLLYFDLWLLLSIKF